MIDRKCLFFLLCTVFLNTVFDAPDSFANDLILIVANTTVPIDALSKTDVRNIFLGIKKKWPDRTNTNIITLNKGIKEHEAFLNHFIKKTPQQYTAYWRNQMFLGKGVIPTSFQSESEIIEYVKNTVGAIGYVSASASTEGVKIITISD